MSAATMPLRGAEAARDALRGRTVLRARTVEHIAAGAVREVAGARATVSVRDDRGMLRIDVALPVVPGAAGTLPERGTALQRHVIARVGDLAARRVRRVDVRYTGLVDGGGRR